MIEILLHDLGKLDIQTKDVLDFGIPLTFNIADIKDISKRKSGFSKTIKILGSKRNNILFKHAFEITASNTFEFNSKYPMSLLVDKNPVMVGNMKLVKIEKLKVGDKFQIVYNVTLSDRVKDLFEDLDKPLSDLDFSTGFTSSGETYETGDHIMTTHIVVNSHDNDYLDVYNYGLISQTQMYNHYGWTSTGDTLAVNYSLFSPMIYHKAIVDKIFDEAGITYEGDYFNSDNFKNMVTPYQEPLVDKILGELVNDGHTIVGDIGQTVYGTPNFTYLKQVTVNPSGLNKILYGYQLAEIQGYGVVVPGGIKIKRVEENAAVDAGGKYFIQLRIEVTQDSAGNTTGSCNPLTYPAKPTKYQIRKIDTNSIDTLLHSFDTSDITLNQFVELDWVAEDLDDGDFVYLKVIPGLFLVDATCTYIPTTTNIRRASLVLYKNVASEDDATFPIVNPNIKINEILPDMTQADFIKNHMRLGNLMITYNTDFDIFNISTWKSFYQKPSIEWTKKIDFNKNITIEKEEIKNYNYLFSNEDEKFTKSYEFWYAKTYGSYYLDNGKDDTVDVQLDFGNYVVRYDSVGTDYFVMQGGDTTYTTTFDYSYYDDRYVSENPLVGFLKESSNENVMGEYYSGITINSLVKYNLFTPFYSHYYIFWGNPEIIKSYPGDHPLLSIVNSYETYYEDVMINWIDPDNRIVTYYCQLTVEDLMNLDFGKRIIIENQLYFLHKIEYDPSSGKSAKITLTKDTHCIYPDGDYVIDLLKYDDTELFIIDSTVKDNIQVN